MSRQRVVAGGHIDTVTPDEMAALLQEFARSGSHAFGSGQVERKRENWPTLGGVRDIRAIGPVPHGAVAQAIAAGAYVDIIPANDGRGGLNVQNVGAANPAYVFLTTAAQARDLNGAVAGYFLAPNGGAWDGRYSGSRWVGDVCVWSLAGTNIAWGEI